MRSRQLLLSASAAAVLAACATAKQGYSNPSDGGGSNLGYFPPNLSSNGEPLNVIISGGSSSQVLTAGGLMTFANALGYGKECLGLHGGTKMQANLGDGQGWRDQEAEARWLYGESPGIGACLETFEGGNHFRSWQQSSSNAWFLAVSEERNLVDKHNITANGYNAGRDKLVSQAQSNPSYNGNQYTTTVKYISGWLPTGPVGIDHGISIDGQTAVLTVTVANSS